MADLLAELEGFLDADTMAKIRNAPVGERLTKASDVFSFYEGETNEPPAPPSRRETPPEVRPPSGTQDLSSIMADLGKITAKFDNLDTAIESKFNTMVEQRGRELRGGAVADSIKITRELSKLDARHRADFGEDLNDEKLSAHVAKAQEEGRPFRTVSDAYEDMTREARFNKKLETSVDSRVREELKARASGNVPGVTSPAATPMLKVLKGGNRQPGDAGTTADKAGAALAARLAERGEVVA